MHGPRVIGWTSFPFAVLVAQNLLSLGFICPGTFSYPTTFGLYDFNILISLYNSDSKFEDFDDCLWIDSRYFLVFQFMEILKATGVL